ncbi:MAG: response regulator [Anaerolineaceae bacterium]|nr:response regulator [Anaerolineaceae bacterium]
MPEKILIVDDDLETLRLVGIMLQRQGYQIIAANSGSQALSMAVSDQPDVVLLDIMMPEMDGYEVARQLRGHPDSAGIPILMFTAKGQVEDKITGYESGADDYLTKPTHPAELNAHIKALLARTVKSRAVPVAKSHGHVVAVMAARGGIGCSTVGINLAVGLAQKTKTGVIAAEFRPGCGAWGLELGYVNPEGIRNLLRYKPAELTPPVVEGELITNASGVRLLLSTNQPKELAVINSTAHFEAILDSLSCLAPIIIVDIGMNLFPEVDKLLDLINEVVVVVDPSPTSVSRTKALLDELVLKGFGKTRALTLVVMNRVRTDVQMTWSQIQEELGTPVAVVISPAPEQAYQSALRLTPMILLQPEGLVAQQFTKLAETVAQHAHLI